mmetsp:Transcript_17660/g.53629  ORF Transcript_17660/g.53629 Transcript_17660/m.53629 type:complete len:221 (-) Transcript_17660:55-717(-)
MRAEVQQLRAQHAELSSLCQQWQQAVSALQQRPPHAAPAGYGHPGGGYPPPYGGGGHGGGGGYGYGHPNPGPGGAPGGGGAWSEHYSPDGHLYYYNASTGASSWEKPAEMGRMGGGMGMPGGGMGMAPRVGGKTKGPPGANLFVAAKGQGPPFSDDLLRQTFQPFGELLRAEMTIDKDTGMPKGYGFVSFSDPASADMAMAQLNQQVLFDKQIRIEKTNT